MISGLGDDIGPVAETGRFNAGPTLRSESRGFKLMIGGRGSVGRLPGPGVDDPSLVVSKEGSVTGCNVTAGEVPLLNVFTSTGGLDCELDSDTIRDDSNGLRSREGWLANVADGVIRGPVPSKDVVANAKRGEVPPMGTGNKELRSGTGPPLDTNEARDDEATLAGNEFTGVAVPGTGSEIPGLRSIGGETVIVEKVGGKAALPVTELVVKLGNVNICDSPRPESNEARSRID